MHRSFSSFIRILIYFFLSHHKSIYIPPQINLYPTTDQFILCTTFHLYRNPICCPDPKHIEVPVDVYRPYSNVCDFSYGKNPQDSSEDAIACGYGTCPVCLCSMIYQPVCCNGVEHPNECMLFVYICAIIAHLSL